VKTSKTTFNNDQPRSAKFSKKMIFFENLNLFENLILSILGKNNDKIPIKDVPMSKKHKSEQEQQE